MAGAARLSVSVPEVLAHLPTMVLAFGEHYRDTLPGLGMPEDDPARRVFRTTEGDSEAEELGCRDALFDRKCLVAERLLRLALLSLSRGFGQDIGQDLLPSFDIVFGQLLTDLFWADARSRLLLDDDRLTVPTLPSGNCPDLKSFLLRGLQKTAFLDPLKLLVELGLGYGSAALEI